MNDWLLFDPMFRVPFATGLALAVTLSLTGALLRMREEWLAALGLSQIAAVGAIVAYPLGLPALAGAFLAAGLATVLRSLLTRVDNSHHALLILLGWSGTLIFGSYIDHGASIGESLLRGQLYFTRGSHLAGAVALLVLLLTLFPWLSPRLLTARFFPDHHQANRVPTWPYKTVFALLVMAATVLGTISIGAFPAFAMLFAPSWSGFVIVNGWRRSLIATCVIGVTAYTLAFTLAMLIDLPFGPVLVASLALSSCLRAGIGIRRYRMNAAYSSHKA